MATYRDAGVDLAAAEEAVSRMAAAVTATWSDAVVGAFGGFAAGLRIPKGYEDPVLMMSTDGVGTKAEVARKAGKLGGLGWDLVAMCADDLVAMGATPLAMTDYIAVGRLIPDRIEAIVASVAAASAETGIALLGGETAEHPGVMQPDEFDLSGAVVGVVEADGVIDGSRVAPGQVVLGLLSPNVRSNGFSLLRAAVLSTMSLDDSLSEGTASEVLLAPSVIYTPAVLRMLKQVPVSAMAHVTGGGIAGNLERVLPRGMGAAIETDAWQRPAVFEDVAEIGGIGEAEMFATFNMGLGFLIVLDENHVDAAVEALGVDCALVGSILAGAGRVELHGIV